MKAFQNMSNLRLLRETKEMKNKVSDIENVIIECEEIIKNLSKQKEAILQNY